MHTTLLAVQSGKLAELKIQEPEKFVRKVTKDGIIYIIKEE